MFTASNASNAAMAKTVAESLTEMFTTTIGKIQLLNLLQTQANSNLSIISNFDSFDPGKEKFD